MNSKTYSLLISHDNSELIYDVYDSIESVTDQINIFKEQYPEYKYVIRETGKSYSNIYDDNDLFLPKNIFKYINNLIIISGLCYKKYIAEEKFFSKPEDVETFFSSLSDEEKNTYISNFYSVLNFEKNFDIVKFHSELFHCEILLINVTIYMIGF